MPADGLRQIQAVGSFSRERAFENFPRLLFHRPSVTSGADAQPGFHRIIQLPDRDARHTSTIALQSPLVRLEFPEHRRDELGNRGVNVNGPLNHRIRRLGIHDVEDRVNGLITADT